MVDHFNESLQFRLVWRCWFLKCLVSIPSKITAKYNSSFKGMKEQFLENLYVASAMGD